MNSLDYIDSVFKIALDQYQNKDEVSVEVSKTILLTVHDRIKKQLNTPLFRTMFEFVEQHPELVNRKCSIEYKLPEDRVEIKFGKQYDTV